MCRGSRPGSAYTHTYTYTSRKARCVHVPRKQAWLGGRWRPPPARLTGTSGAATAAPGIRARPAATPHEKIAVLEVEEEEVFRSVFERQMLGECYCFSC